MATRSQSLARGLGDRRSLRHTSPRRCISAATDVPLAFGLASLLSSTSMVLSDSGLGCLDQRLSCFEFPNLSATLAFQARLIGWQCTQRLQYALIKEFS